MKTQTKPKILFITALTVLIFIFACESEGNNNSSEIVLQEEPLNFFEVNGDTTYIDKVYEQLKLTFGVHVYHSRDTIIEEFIYSLPYRIYFIFINDDITYDPYELSFGGLGDILIINFSSYLYDSIPTNTYKYGDTLDSIYYTAYTVKRLTDSTSTSDTSEIITDMSNGIISINRIKEKYLINFQFNNDSGHIINGYYNGMTKFYDFRKLKSFTE